jgi:septum formation protein
MSKDTLYLASGSAQRKLLLEQAKINFKVINHGADEATIIFDNNNFKNYVLNIAQEKLKHANLHEIKNVQEGQIIFVLSADTLVYTHKTGHILGKPKDINDAKNMLKIMRDQLVDASTGCCLAKKVFKNNSWQTLDKNYWVTTSQVEFIVQDQDFDTYFINLPQALNSASSGIIENYGQRFCKTINGSYSNIIGLPIFELVQALQKMQFKF